MLSLLPSCTIYSCSGSSHELTTAFIDSDCKLFQIPRIRFAEIERKAEFLCLATVANVPCGLACKISPRIELWVYQLAYELKLTIYNLFSRHSAVLTANSFSGHCSILEFSLVFFIYLFIYFFWYPRQAKLTSNSTFSMQLKFVFLKMKWISALHVVWNDRLVYIQLVKQLYARNKSCKCLFTKLSGWWWWYWLPDGTMWDNICDTKWRERHACAPIIPRLAPFDWILIMIHSHNCVFIWYFNGSCCI